MDKDTVIRLLRSWLTGWALSLGCCLCLAAAFRLDAPRSMALLCCVFSLGCTCITAFPLRKKLLLPLLALALGYFSRLHRIRESFLGFGRQILEVFHRAYGWQQPEAVPVAAEYRLPLGALALLLCLGVSRSVCLRKSSLLPLLLGGGCLALCVMAPDPAPEAWALFLLLESMGILLFTGQVRRQQPLRETQLWTVSALALGIFLAAILLGNPKCSYVNHSERLRQRLSLAVGVLPGNADRILDSLLPRTVTDAPQQLSLETLGSREPGTAPVLTVTAQSSGALYLRQRDYDVYDGRTWSSSQRRTETILPTGGGEPVLLRTREEMPLLLLPQPCGDALTLTGGTVENPTGLTEYTLLRGAATTEAPPDVCLELPTQTREGLALRLPQDPSPQAVAELLSQGSYSLSPEIFPEEAEDFALWFLDSGMEGYCLHYAAAAAVLLRGCGIPARLVTGYLVETEPGVEITVTEGQAHAWAEYYDISGSCWRILDATPSAGETVAEPIANEEPAPDTVPEQKPPPLQVLLWVIPAFCFSAAVLGYMPRFLRRRRMYRGSPNAQALGRWREALRLARLLGESPHPELYSLAQKARFSPHAITEEELCQFDSYLRSCHIRLEKNSFIKRLVLNCFLGVY